jgi:hypothetical protein
MTVKVTGYNNQYNINNIIIMFVLVNGGLKLYNNR